MYNYFRVASVYIPYVHVRTYLQGLTLVPCPKTPQEYERALVHPFRVTFNSLDLFLYLEIIISK